ncbi:hypothetical protein [Acidianus sp. HS-5]|uniref:hypothetical protein n=1 Tax=Acidianus sp. HS-5 TaxID=2886040 RepID=UPI001F1ECCED|nr:hypothetical protein [Acidianus sp. HS-5]BDC17941.1 hypothetical protein HS5_08310 [Acidianus sp. HS-5]
MYIKAYTTVYPAKAVFANLNGTVNGKKVVIRVFAASWSSSNNGASELYKDLNCAMKNPSALSRMENNYKFFGDNISVSTYNGLDFYLSETHNRVEFVGVSNNEEIEIFISGINASASQVEALVNNVMSCL